MIMMTMTMMRRKAGEVVMEATEAVTDDLAAGLPLLLLLLLHHHHIHQCRDPAPGALS